MALLLFVIIVWKEYYVFFCYGSHLWTIFLLFLHERNFMFFFCYGSLLLLYGGNIMVRSYGSLCYYSYFRYGSPQCEAPGLSGTKQSKLQSGISSKALPCINVRQIAPIEKNKKQQHRPQNLINKMW